MSLCNICANEVTDPKDCTEVMVLGNRRVYHTSCQAAVHNQREAAAAVMKERAMFYLTARQILLTELSFAAPQVRLLPADEMQNQEHRDELEVLQWLRDQVVEKL